MTVRVRVFRRKAIGALAVLLAIVAVLALRFAEPIARETTEDASTDLLGTQVDIAKLDLHPTDVAATLRGRQIADPFALERNLVEADRISVQLDPRALAEKKLVVERLSLNGLRFGTRRREPARPVERQGLAPQLIRTIRDWSRRFDVPLLKLTPIDTLKQLVLDPSQLRTVQAAQALAQRADSTRRATEQALAGLEVAQTVDSAEALVQQLDGFDPRRAGLQGTRAMIQSVQQTIGRVAQTRERLATLARDALQGAKGLGTGVQQLDEARRRDYAFARSLLQLPSFAAPDIGKSFFGPVSVARFEQAMYWVQLARASMPPGLLPRQTTGPDRLRMAGTTVGFPKERAYPAFLLQAGDVDFSIAGDGPLAGAYEARVQGLTSTPALYGRPTILAASHRAEGPLLASVDAAAVLNHLGRGPRDSIGLHAVGLGLPTIELPGLPVRVEPGRGRATLSFALRGDSLSGRWTIASDDARWAIDTAGRPLNPLEQLVWRVVTGLGTLTVTAEVTGTVSSPRLAVSSNLDAAVADRIPAVLGEEVAKAERRARAAVDRIVEERVEPVRRQVTQAQDQIRPRLETDRKRLAAVQDRLEAELKRITGPAGELVKLPKLPVP